VKTLAFGLRLGLVRALAIAAAVLVLPGCRVLSSGLAPSDPTASPADARAAALDGAEGVPDAGEPPGVAGAGCSDGTREGFRDSAHWPDIAGCAGAFEQAGVVGTPDLPPACNLGSGDSSANPLGTRCGAADLCAPHWHVCRNGGDVAKHSPTGCEGCVSPGEPRFFLVASGASSFGVCSPEPREANDLHGCGGLGQPESAGCAPLTRRMGFADCLATDGIWSCGSDVDSLREAVVVTKARPARGGVLCCRD
jgi:hypothetical protein